MQSGTPAFGACNSQGRPNEDAELSELSPNILAAGPRQAWRDAINENALTSRGFLRSTGRCCSEVGALI
jgi:hypothetical protein